MMATFEEEWNLARYRVTKERVVERAAEAGLSCHRIAQHRYLLSFSGAEEEFDHRLTLLEEMLEPFRHPKPKG